MGARGRGEGQACGRTGTSMAVAAGVEADAELVCVSEDEADVASAAAEDAAAAARAADRRPLGGEAAAKVRPAAAFCFPAVGAGAEGAAAPPRRSLAFLSGAARGHARARHHAARPCVKARVARGRGMLLPRTFAVCSTAAKALRVQRVWAPPAAQRHHGVSLSHDHADSPDRVSHRVLNRRMFSTLRAALPFFGKQAASRTGGAHGVVRRRAAAAGCRNEGTQGVRSGVKGCSRAAGAGGRRGRCEGKGGGGQCEAGGRGGATR